MRTSLVAMVLCLVIGCGGCGSSNHTGAATGGGNGMGSGGDTGIADGGGTAGDGVGGATGGIGAGGSFFGTGGETGTGGLGTGAASAGGMTGGGTGGENPGGGGMGEPGTGGAPAQDLVLLYRFDEETGTTASDSSGFAGGPRNGTLTNADIRTVTFSATAPLAVGSHYLALAGIVGYVDVPTLQTLQELTPAAVTFATWVYVTPGLMWQHIFDFGIDPATGGNPVVYTDLTASQDFVLFSITRLGNQLEETIVSRAPFTINAWHHLAIVLPTGGTYTGTLYIDGVAAGTNAAMTLHPASLVGQGTPHGYIGKSGFPADPYFGGRIDDFRVYNRALTADDVAAVFALR